MRREALPRDEYDRRQQSACVTRVPLTSMTLPATALSCIVIIVLAKSNERFTMQDLAKHCGVSWRTLEKTFTDFRGVTAVAHVRNLRLDRARQPLDAGNVSVSDVTARCGFGSSTTFALEYRKRFGTRAEPREARGLELTLTGPRAFAPASIRDIV